MSSHATITLKDVRDAMIVLDATEARARSAHKPYKHLNPLWEATALSFNNMVESGYTVSVFRPMEF